MTRFDDENRIVKCTNRQMQTTRQPHAHETLQGAVDLYELLFSGRVLSCALLTNLISTYRWDHQARSGQAHFSAAVNYKL